MPTHFINANGVSSGLNAGHAGGHLALELPLNERWDAEIGKGGDEFVELPVPVVGANGHVFAVSASGEVSALDIELANYLGVCLLKILKMM